MITVEIRHLFLKMETSKLLEHHENILGVLFRG